jgi:DNA invertase Pin-like site-specific DNA recombinase
MRSVGCVIRDGPIACVIYAAKSTEDRRGSIPGQLRECREAVESAGGRMIVGEYSDEAFSAFVGSRGPGLAQAMRRAQELARDGAVELWAQHSDRLARGDGRSARHAVEIALWALKNDVRVRTIQDPETFRDLLYAVVTGQRNHEDSRRKGLASAAGRRRAVERGDYTGAKPDGYMRVVEVDASGAVKKRLVVDPARRRLIEMIFGMALCGKGTAAIARAVNEAGWQTKPLIGWQRPKAWDVRGVLDVLNNPRYAGLAAYKGEVIARGNWPAYITDREYYRMKRRRSRPKPTKTPRKRETFLLARLGKCGICGSSLHCFTDEQRSDGTFPRRYLCWSHNRGGNGSPRCPSLPMDADLVESMFASAIHRFLLEGEEDETARAELATFEGAWADSPERQRVLDAVRQGDEAALDCALEALVTRVAPETMLLKRIVASTSTGRQLELAHIIENWAAQERAGRTDSSRAETRELNDALRARFCRVSVAMDGRYVSIVAHRWATNAAGKDERRINARFDRRESQRYLPLARKSKLLHRMWDDSEIIASLQDWSVAHGRSPKCTDWSRASWDRPGALTVRRRFGGWRKALRRAGLKPDGREYDRAAPRCYKQWSATAVVRALQDATRAARRPPRSTEWFRAAPDHPCSTTVRQRFGSWTAALEAAGLDSR